ncbi:beta-carotene 15,15'-monooxygenase [Tetragenococcus osmophilus]|uniref:Beta-carotene 15,15'-monooxygenase n=1 Tax=Tetragenococcus osmophilus TaxID=526944 RepID=A0AA37XLI8_9ENTE|nr:permease prefix domain 1-containing protein [Tetragenococcus osmophilus]AYW47449.1 beta-carotene 15,15'-monooxygenase [Tetragenococcus osmophilus]GMA53044.1 hypothetical protein GCM10025857_44010 [Alicyclobacillus contaminans]GMA72977.1 hypothetical protein GCM10025885_20260 [Tetragenococcus osmophilus]
MKTIKNYLDSLFLNVPKTPETEKAKEDLLSNMEDHYYELINEGKSEQEAIGTVISEFGSIDELLAELELDKEQRKDNEFLDAIGLEEAFEFWATVRRFALVVSLGILSFCFALSGVVFANYGSIISVLAVIFFFVLVAIGVGLIVPNGMKYSKAFELLEDRPLTQRTRTKASEKLKDYEKSFRYGLTVGIGLCILAIPCIIFFDELFGLTILGTSLFFSIAGIGIFLIVYTSIIYDGFKKMTENNYFISDEDEPGPRATKDTYGENAPFFNFFRRIYWPAIVVIYFLGSSIMGAWSYSWLIFVLAGPIYSFIMERGQNDKEDEEQ